MAKLRKDEAIGIAEQFIRAKGINASIRDVCEPDEKSAIWQIIFDLILPENITVDPSYTVVEIDDASGYAEFGYVI